MHHDWTKYWFLTSPIGHIRDPNNQLQVVKNLRICVNNVVTSTNTPSATLGPSQCRLLNEVVSSCQPQEGAVNNVVTAGEYNLNVSGKDWSLYDLPLFWNSYSTHISYFLPRSVLSTSRHCQWLADNGKFNINDY